MSTRYKRGKLRGDKVEYEDGIGCCIWYPLFPTEEEKAAAAYNEGIDGLDDEDTGICFDFSFDDIDDMIALLQDLKTAEPDIFKDDSGQA